MTSLANSNAGPIAHPHQPARYDGFDADDFKMPMARLYHGTTEEEERYGAGKFQRGDLVNTLTVAKLASRNFVPATGWKEYIQFDPNDQKSILWRTKDKQEALKRAGGGDLYDVTFYNYVAVFEGEDSPLLLSFSATGQNAAKTLNMLERNRGAKGKGPGFYAFETEKRVSTGVDKNTGEIDPSKKGKTYLRPAIRPLGDAPPELLEAANALYESMAGSELSMTDVVEGDPQFDPNAA